MKTTVVACDSCERTFPISSESQFPNTIELMTGDYCIDCIARCVQFALDNGMRLPSKHENIGKAFQQINQHKP